MNYKDVDPKIKRLFPWALFLVLTALFLLASCVITQAQPAPDISCEEVVRRVGLKPLWLAERQARKQYPDITDAQIAWGRQCVTDHRKAVVKGIINKVEGAF